MLSTNSSYQIRCKPYNGGSTVLNSTFYGNLWYNQSGSNSSQSFNEGNSYLRLGYHQGQNMPLSQLNGKTMDSTGNGYSPSNSGKMIWENNKVNASYYYEAWVRFDTNNSHTSYEFGHFGANNNQTTTNHADSFYIYPGSGSYTEGIFLLYAITK